MIDDAEYLVRDMSGRGSSVGQCSAEEIAEPMDGEESFADALTMLDVGDEMRIDGATVIVRTR